MRVMWYKSRMTEIAGIEPSWIPDTTTLGARLALTRWKMGWNIGEAERECGLSQNSWANWESGAEPRKFIETVGKIAWRTKVDRIWLMTGDGNPQGPEDPTLDYGSDDSPAGEVVDMAAERGKRLQRA